MTHQARARNANIELYELGTVYHNSLPIQKLDCILEKWGFRPTEPAIYCGRDGQALEQVGDRTWLSFTWHKMELTGRYEVVAYLS